MRARNNIIKPWRVSSLKFEFRFGARYVLPQLLKFLLQYSSADLRLMKLPILLFKKTARGKICYPMLPPISAQKGEIRQLDS